MTLRNDRVRKAIQKEVADIIQKKLNDERIGGVVSITDVEVSHDNTYAKVFYSVFAPENIKEQTERAIEEDTPKIRYEIGKRIRLRVTPEIKLIKDISIERGARVTELINKISEEHREREN